LTGVVLKKKDPQAKKRVVSTVEKVKKIVVLTTGKDFIKSCGEAWQCILCKKVCSNRIKAIIHIEEEHSSALNMVKDEALSDTPMITNHSSTPSLSVWICDICKSRCSTKENAILHMQLSHKISRKRAIENSIMKVFA